MAEVLEAYVSAESGFERKVAIKRVLPQYGGDESFLRGFMDEARIVSQLHHANIVSVFDFGVMDDLPFLVMDYVDGLDLASLRDQAGALPPEIALHVTTE